MKKTEIITKKDGNTTIIIHQPINITEEEKEIVLKNLNEALYKAWINTQLKSLKEF